MDPAALGAALGALILALGGAIYEWWQGRKLRGKVLEMDEIDARDSGDREQLYDEWRKIAREYYGGGESD